MCVKFVIKGEIENPGLKSLLQVEMMPSLLNLTAPISIILSFDGERPVVSVSKAVKTVPFS